MNPVRFHKEDAIVDSMVFFVLPLQQSNCARTHLLSCELFIEQ